MKDKEGNKLTTKEYFKRWGDGIKSLSPEQKVSNEFNATLIMLVGFIVALVALVIFRDKLIVSWFAYGLILIFAGNTWGTTIRLIGFYQQKQFFKNIKEKMQGEDEEEKEEVILKISKDSKGPKIKGGKNLVGFEDVRLEKAVTEKVIKDEKNKTKRKKTIQRRK